MLELSIHLVFGLSLSFLPPYILTTSCEGSFAAYCLSMETAHMHMGTNHTESIPAAIIASMYNDYIPE